MSTESASIQSFDTSNPSYTRTETAVHEISVQFMHLKSRETTTPLIKQSMETVIENNFKLVQDFIWSHRVQNDRRASEIDTDAAMRIYPVARDSIAYSFKTCVDILIDPSSTEIQRFASLQILLQIPNKQPFIKDVNGVIPNLINAIILDGAPSDLVKELTNKLGDVILKEQEIEKLRKDKEELTHSLGILQGGGHIDAGLARAELLGLQSELETKTRLCDNLKETLEKLKGDFQALQEKYANVNPQFLTEIQPYVEELQQTKEENRHLRNENSRMSKLLAELDEERKAHAVELPANWGKRKRVERDTGKFAQVQSYIDFIARHNARYHIHKEVKMSIRQISGLNKPEQVTFQLNNFANAKEMEIFLRALTYCLYRQFIDPKNRDATRWHKLFTHLGPSVIPVFCDKPGMNHLAGMCFPTKFSLTLAIAIDFYKKKLQMTLLNWIWFTNGSRKRGRSLSRLKFLS